MSYAKLHSSIVDSSIWCEDAETCKVWVTMLALADRDGVVDLTPAALARRAQIERRKVDEALARFMAPDPDSRTPDHEGRRIAPNSSGCGFVLLNYEAHRERGSDAERRRKNAERQKRYRERRACERVDSDDSNALRNAPLRHVTPPSVSALEGGVGGDAAARDPGTLDNGPEPPCDAPEILAPQRSTDPPARQQAPDAAATAGDELLRLIDAHRDLYLNHHRGRADPAGWACTAGKWLLMRDGLAQMYRRVRDGDPFAGQRGMPVAEQFDVLRRAYVAPSWGDGQTWAALLSRRQPGDYWRRNAFKIADALDASANRGSGRDAAPSAAEVERRKQIEEDRALKGRRS
jgi:hypothetical protein